MPKAMTMSSVLPMIPTMAMIERALLRPISRRFHFEEKASPDERDRAVRCFTFT